MAELGFWDILGLINAQFPQYVPILEKPGIFDVFVRYAQAKSSGVNPWTSDQFLAELHKTPYYQQTTDKARQFDLLKSTDPATAKARAADTKRIFDDLGKQLGMTLDTTGGFNSPSFKLFTQAVAEGWDAQRIKYELSATVNGTQAGGEIGKNASDVKKMADDYAVPLSDQATMGYARQLSEGAIDANGIQGYLKEQAKSLFPTLGAALDKGITVRQYMDPYLQLAQQELNINPATISLTDGKWLKLINTTDPKTGERSPMTLDQALTTFRTDSAFGYDQTDKAKQDATQLASQLQQKFGAA